ncbi:DEAD/DEAH box helicase family protein [Bacillaceae bacterium S4-13-58]
MSRIQLVTENVGEEIIRGIQQATSIYILTSFIMKSGVDMIKPHLVEAAKRGADIKICAGDYLYITQPEALKELILPEYKNEEVRLWRSNGASFHPKAYLFKDVQDGTFIIGSSNLSRSALTSGVEWNVAMDKESAPDTFEKAAEKFLTTFYDSQTITINEETVKSYTLKYDTYHQKHPNLAKKWAEQEEIELMLPVEKPQTKLIERVIDPPETYTTKIEPRPAQQMALDELEAAMEEDYDKAMVVMATGLGKTYLAAFFAQKFQRVLFIAHREEILFQAQKSFQRVLPEKSTGIYNGKIKEGEADHIFASIFTFSAKEHLEMFPRDHFDLIVVDEFHHAAATSYQKVLEYFHPKFLLGITATPDRMDGKDVYAICDGNVAFQMHFIEAIEKGWLAPFHYYGVYDDTDYSQITWLGSKYDQGELLAAQLREDLAQTILEGWEKHKQSRTLAFCSSIKQAQFLSNHFNQNGYHTISLTSGTVDISRDEAIQKLENGELDVIFTVDLFNEGVDIPPVDTLLFARPTESLTVFTQQVGRGLRLHNEKTHCNIIDLTGNYRNADLKLSLFNVERDQKEGKKRKEVVPIIPSNCHIDLDVRVIDLLKELTKKKQPRKERLLHAYQEVKEELGQRPTYLEMHLYGNVNSKEFKQEFKSYVGFLNWAGELNEEESKVYEKYSGWLEEVEKTGMAKSYKMVLLSYMLSRGEDGWHLPVRPEEVANYFHSYLMEKEYRRKIDFSDKTTKRLWEYDQKKVADLISKMPMTRWSGSSGGLLVFEGGLFGLGFEVDERDLVELYKMTRQVCEYRLHGYFERKNESTRPLI